MKIEIDNEFISELVKKGPDYLFEDINVSELVKQLPRGSNIFILNALLQLIGGNKAGWSFVCGIIVGQKMLAKKYETEKLEELLAK